MQRTRLAAVCALLLVLCACSAPSIQPAARATTSTLDAAPLLGNVSGLMFVPVESWQVDNTKGASNSQTTEPAHCNSLIGIDAERRATLGSSDDARAIALVYDSPGAAAQLSERIRQCPTFTMYSSGQPQYSQSVTAHVGSPVQNATGTFGFTIACSTGDERYPRVTPTQAVGAVGVVRGLTVVVMTFGRGDSPPDPALADTLFRAQVERITHR